MPDSVLDTFSIGAQWKTLDPFLFCAYHLDHYPAGNQLLGPEASLEGRIIGQDFGGIDGWNMYHGSTVPGFPQHPHRGFETVTYLRRGWCDHSDSLGARARFGPGDTQWLTAGSGIVHSEMFPLLSTSEPNPLQLFQIWLNLPRRSKMVQPRFSMYWNHDIPKLGSDEGGYEVTVITGSYFDGDSTVVAPDPPQDSWAAQDDSDVNIWHITVGPGGSIILPLCPPDSHRVLYFFEGTRLLVGSTAIDVNTAVILPPGAATRLEAPDRDQAAECMVLQARPISEPVVQHGPFVLNDQAGIRQAIIDYGRTGFGGWPWPTPDPTHGSEARRFVWLQPGQIPAEARVE